MSNQTVSIITPTFNCGKFIQETYDSILKQTYAQWEWVVVDDGSSDNTTDLIRRWQQDEPRIKFFRRNDEPRGAAACRNLAVTKCQGDYLIFLDGDDVLSAQCLNQRIGQMLAQPEMDFMVFQMLMFEKRPEDLRLLWNLPDGCDDLDRAIRLNPLMAGSSTIWKKQSFVSIGMWDEHLLMNQDIELHIRALCSGMRYDYRLQLPPDLYVRNNPSSISREKKKSPGKQYSRVYYFGRIQHHLRKHQLEKKHAGAIRWLFLKLFFDLSHDGAIGAARQLCTEQQERIKQFPILHRLIIDLVRASGRFAFVPVGIIRQLNKTAAFLKGGTPKTFGVLRYEGEIG